MTINTGIVRYASEVHKVMSQAHVLEFVGPNVGGLITRLEMGFECEQTSDWWLTLRVDALGSSGGLAILDGHVARVIAWLCEGIANGHRDDTSIVVGALFDDLVKMIHEVTRRRYLAVLIQHGPPPGQRTLNAAADEAVFNAINYLGQVGLRLLLERDSAA